MEDAILAFEYNFAVCMQGSECEAKSFVNRSRITATWWLKVWLGYRWMGCVSANTWAGTVKDEKTCISENFKVLHDLAWRVGRNRDELWSDFSPQTCLGGWTVRTVSIYSEMSFIGRDFWCCSTGLSSYSLFCPSQYRIDGSKKPVNV